MAGRSHNESEWKREQALKLRVEDNLTYREIAEEMGISKAYVALLLKDVAKKNFHRWTYESAPYPMLIKWMNDNQVTKLELARALGYSSCPSSQQIVYKRLKKGRFEKSEIDTLLRMTGMDYNTLFNENVPTKGAKRNDAERA